jgi:hypothetical protein
LGGNIMISHVYKGRDEVLAGGVNH